MNMQQESIEARIAAGKAAVMRQVPFFRQNFGRVESQWKEDKSRVTIADLTISKAIIEELRALFPQDDYCTEESDPHAAVRDLKAEYTWILDPVDGTNNFAIGFPMCGISLGLLKGGMPHYGFLYDFGRDRLVTGGPGFGLYDGDVKVGGLDRARALDRHSMVSIAFPFRDWSREHLLPFVHECNIRSIGSGALALTYTALGTLDGVIDLRSKTWDVAAALAFAGAVGLPVHPLDTPQFPLKTFDIQQKPGPIYAGTDAFCARVAKSL
jgi:myo-inositol-1(or 4)-monophosphatase